MYKKENFYVKNEDGIWNRYSYNTIQKNSDTLLVKINNCDNHTSIEKIVDLNSLFNSVTYNQNQYDDLAFEDVADMLLAFVSDTIKSEM